MDTQTLPDNDPQIPAEQPAFPPAAPPAVPDSTNVPGTASGLGPNDPPSVPPYETVPSRVAPMREGEELWEILVEGAVWLKVTAHNRFGQPMERDMPIGPQQVGRKFRISALDREYNQSLMTNAAQDPFRNGMLRRISEHPNEDDTSRALATSEAQLNAAELSDILDLRDQEFEAAASALSEVPLRRLYDLTGPLDATTSQVEFLENLIRERYSKSKGQDAAQGAVDDPLEGGERLT